MLNESAKFVQDISLFSYYKSIKIDYDSQFLLRILRGIVVKSKYENIFNNNHIEHNNKNENLDKPVECKRIETRGL